MAFDRDSFLAGFAVGRTLWRPHNLSGGSDYFYQVKRSDIVDVTTSAYNRWAGPMGGHTRMDYPDTYYHVKYAGLEINASWVADTDVSWRVTYDFIASNPQDIPYCTAGLSRCTITTQQFHEDGCEVYTVGSKAFEVWYTTIDGQSHYASADYTADYLVDSGQSGVITTDVGYASVIYYDQERVTHLDGYIYLPLLVRRASE